MFIDRKGYVMRTRLISSVVSAVFLSPLAIAQATAAPAPAPTSLPAALPTQAVPQLKKAPPKWACNRIYIEGKPSRPTALKVWCNGGKTLIKLKTPGLKPGVKASYASYRNFSLKKGKYHSFSVMFRKQDGGKNGELRVFYNYGDKFAIAIRNPWLATPKQTRVLV